MSGKRVTGPARHTVGGIIPATGPGEESRDFMELNPEEMTAVVKRLKRAQGQLGGIIKMIEDGRQCQDIVTQMAAVSKAVDRAGFATISLGLRQCMADPEHNAMDVAAMEKLFLSLA